jgi:hypothetical protein
MVRGVFVYEAHDLGEMGSILPWSDREPPLTDVKLGNVWSR